MYVHVKKKLHKILCTFVLVFSCGLFDFWNRSKKKFSANTAEKTIITLYPGIFLSSEDAIRHRVSSQSCFGHTHTHLPELFECVCEWGFSIRPFHFSPFIWAMAEILDVHTHTQRERHDCIFYHLVLRDKDNNTAICLSVVFSSHRPQRWLMYAGLSRQPVTADGRGRGRGREPSLSHALGSCPGATWPCRTHMNMCTWVSAYSHVSTQTSAHTIKDLQGLEMWRNEELRSKCFWMSRWGACLGVDYASVCFQNAPLIFTLVHIYSHLLMWKRCWYFVGSLFWVTSFYLHCKKNITWHYHTSIIQELVKKQFFFCLLS